MIQKSLFILLSFLFLLGCSSGKREFVVPTPSEMALILADVHIAEATLADNGATVLSENHKGGYKLVLEKYGLDKSGFDSSIAYYTAQPRVYQKIYEDVLAILTEKEMAIRSLKDDTIKISKPKNDSIVNGVAQNLWKSERAIKINHQDSSRFKAHFDNHVDSILGGEITLKAKYKFNSNDTIGIKPKMLLLITYSDGSKDSTQADIKKSTALIDVSSKVTLKQIPVLKVSGNIFMQIGLKPIDVEIKDISLDWTKPHSLEELEKKKE